MKELRLEIKIRNNRLLELMEKQGIKSSAHLARLIGFSVGCVCHIMNIKYVWSVRGDGSLNPCASAICEYFKVDQEYLFPKKLASITKNRISTSISVADLKRLSSAEQGYSDPQLNPRVNGLTGLLRRSMTTLTDKERDAVLMAYCEEKTDRDIGLELGVTGHAIGLRLAKARRKIRAIAGPELLEYYREG